MAAQVFPVVRGVPAVGPSAVVLPPLGGVAALTSAPVEEDLDGPMAEESDTGPEEEL